MYLSTLLFWGLGGNQMLFVPGMTSLLGSHLNRLLKSMPGIGVQFKYSQRVRYVHTFPEEGCEGFVPVVIGK